MIITSDGTSPDLPENGRWGTSLVGSPVLNLFQDQGQVNEFGGKMDLERELLHLQDMLENKRAFDVIGAGVDRLRELLHQERIKNEILRSGFRAIHRNLTKSRDRGQHSPVGRETREMIEMISSIQDFSLVPTELSEVMRNKMEEIISLKRLKIEPWPGKRPGRWSHKSTF